MSDFVVITGMSGAGRSETAKHLEDLGWFVIDNLPHALMPKVAELASAPGTTHDKVALVVRSVGEQGDEVAQAIRDLRGLIDGTVRVLFLEAFNPVLVRRYEATRHRHPYEEAGSIEQAIELERSALEPLRGEADLEINTSELNVHQLRDRLLEFFGDDKNDTMQIRVLSFGFKHGLPLDVDMVFDLRFLPNPHWVEELRPQTGLDAPVRDYVLSQAASGAFLAQLESMLELLVPEFIREGKAYLTVALGCTGGHHRSVAITEAVAAKLRTMGHNPGVTHRDIAR